jgi:hypothetical protein
MRTFNLPGMTRYAAGAIADAYSDRELIELLRRSDGSELLVELRRVVAGRRPLSASAADAELLAAALDSVDWARIVAIVHELVEIEVRLPCGHETTLASFGSEDTRHGGESHAVESYERSCETCKQTWQIELTSSAEGSSRLHRQFVFTTVPTEAVYRQVLSFHDGNELPSCSSGKWVGPSSEQRKSTAV